MGKTRPWGEAGMRVYDRYAELEYGLTLQNKQIEDRNTYEQAPIKWGKTRTWEKASLGVYDRYSEVVY